MMSRVNFLAHTCRNFRHLTVTTVSVANGCYSLPNPSATRIFSRGLTFDYEREKKNFNLHVPEYYNFTRDMVDMWAEKESVSLSWLPQQKLSITELTT